MKERVKCLCNRFYTHTSLLYLHLLDQSMQYSLHSNCKIKTCFNLTIINKNRHYCSVIKRQIVLKNPEQTVSADSITWQLLLGTHLRIKIIVQNRTLVKSVYQFFSYFSTKTYVVGTRKKRLNETVFERPKHMFKLMGKKIFNSLRSKIVFI